MKISDELFNKIFNNQFEDEFINRINNNVNIPIISEKTEKRIITALYFTTKELLKDVLVEKST